MFNPGRHKKIDIGVDPDSKKYGVAVYRDNCLTELASINLFDLLDLVKFNIEKCDRLTVSIEDVCANNFLYSRNSNKNKSIEKNIMLKMGRCQQSQTLLEQGLGRLDGVTIKKFKPMKGNWSTTDRKSIFMKATGWEGLSNPDTRSAAFFGYLGLEK